MSPVSECSGRFHCCDIFVVPVAVVTLYGQLTRLLRHRGTCLPNYHLYMARDYPTYTWEQVAQHCTQYDCWVYVGDSVYDVTQWINRHPGGTKPIVLSAGRDITDLIRSYHPFAINKVLAVLESYKIGEISEKEFPQFHPDTGFYTTVCQRVKEYFDRTGKDSRNPIPALMRLVSVVSIALIAYYISFIKNVSFPIAFFSAVVLGVCQALPLLQVMHDASHFALSNSPFMWNFIGKLTMDWYAGTAMDAWHHQHILGHHIYTNIMGVDPDLPMEETGDIRRVTLWQKWNALYYFQHIYLLFLYGFLTLKVRYTDFSDMLIKQTNGAIRMNPQDMSFYFWSVASKFFWISYRIFVPLFYYQMPTGRFLALFFTTEMISGWYLAFNFQVSHISPEALFPQCKTNLDDEWAVVQVKSSVDYGHGNTAVTFLSGALNYQIVHHLFPGVAQFHYPQIAPIVMSVCKEFGIPYNRMDTFADAFGAHVRHLHLLGAKQKH